nr:unnamed protein product [Callosobruchus chinensis]
MDCVVAGSRRPTKSPNPNCTSNVYLKLN